MVNSKDKYCVRHTDSHIWMILGREETLHYIKELTGYDFVLGDTLSLISSTYNVQVKRLNEGDVYNEYTNTVIKNKI